jgi:hypothetical protein
MIDWSHMKPASQPTRKERGRYQRWVKYLKDSRLTEEQIHERATRLTEQGREPDL